MKLFLRLLNPANGSWRIVQVLAIYAEPALLMNSSNLNNPPTAVGGIPELLC